MTEKVEKVIKIEEEKKKKELSFGKRRLSGTGYVCVQTDREDFRSIPSVLVLFEKELSRNDLIKGLTDSVVSVPKNYRLRCKLNASKSRFIEIPNFIEKKLPKLIHYIKLKSDEELYEKIEDRIFKPFDEEALWEIVAFQNYSKGWLLWFR